MADAAVGKVVGVAEIVRLVGGSVDVGDADSAVGVADGAVDSVVGAVDGATVTVSLVGGSVGDADATVGDSEAVDGSAVGVAVPLSSATVGAEVAVGTVPTLGAVDGASVGAADGACVVTSPPPRRNSDCRMP